MSTKNLEELYTTGHLSVLKKAIAELTKKQDYKTLNTLFRRNPNTSKFDTRLLNEDIPQNNKRFRKHNGKLCNVAKLTPRTTPQSDLYDPNMKSFHDPSYTGSRIRSRYQIVMMETVLSIIGICVQNWLNSYFVTP